MGPLFAEINFHTQQGRKWIVLRLVCFNSGPLSGPLPKATEMRIGGGAMAGHNKQSTCARYGRILVDQAPGPAL